MTINLWGRETQNPLVISADTGVQRTPVVASVGLDAFAVAWIDNNRVSLKFFDEQGNVDAASPQVTVTDATSANLSDLQMTPGGAGIGYGIAWSENNGGVDQLKLRYYNHVTSSTLGGEIAISSNTAIAQHDLEISGYNKDDAARKSIVDGFDAVWVEGAGGAHALGAVYIQRFAVPLDAKKDPISPPAAAGIDGTIGAGSDAQLQITTSGRDPSVAGLNAGLGGLDETIVTWIDATNNINIRAFNNAGTQLNTVTGVVITNVNTAARPLAAGTQQHVTALQGGGFLVAWISANGANHDLVGRIFTPGAAGGAWTSGPIFVIDPLNNGSNAITDFAVAAQETDGFSVSWTAADGATSAIFSRVYTGGGIANDDGAPAIFHAPANANHVAATGIIGDRYVAVYEDNAVDGGDISAKILDPRFDPNGLPITINGPGITMVGDPLFETRGLIAGDVLVGTDGRDTINGRQGDDIMDGGLGNDTILAGLGNDTIDGGGGDDTLVLSGRFTIDGNSTNDDYTLSYLGGGLFQISDKRGGTVGEGIDFARSIENFQFLGNAPGQQVFTLTDILGIQSTAVTPTAWGWTNEDVDRAPNLDGDIDVDGFIVNPGVTAGIQHNISVADSVGEFVAVAWEEAATNGADTHIKGRFYDVVLAPDEFIPNTVNLSDGIGIETNVAIASGGANSGWGFVFEQRDNAADTTRELRTNFMGPGQLVSAELSVLQETNVDQHDAAIFGSQLDRTLQSPVGGSVLPTGMNEGYNVAWISTHTDGVDGTLSAGYGRVMMQRFELVLDPLGNPSAPQAAGIDGIAHEGSDAALWVGNEDGIGNDGFFGRNPSTSALHTFETGIVWIAKNGAGEKVMLRMYDDLGHLIDYPAGNNLSGAFGVAAGTNAHIVSAGAVNFAVVWITADATSPSGYTVMGTMLSSPGSGLNGEGFTMGAPAEPFVLTKLPLGFNPANSDFAATGLSGEDSNDLALSWTVTVAGQGTNMQAQHIATVLDPVTGIALNMHTEGAIVTVNAETTGNQHAGGVAGLLGDRFVAVFEDDNATYTDGADLVARVFDTRDAVNPDPIVGDLIQNGGRVQARRDVLVGTNGNDNIRGDILDNDGLVDWIFAGMGDDVVQGGPGIQGAAGIPEIIDGGEGIDTAVYTGRLQDYSITANGDGSYEVIDLRAVRAPSGQPQPNHDGIDNLYNVEKIKFLDLSNNGASAQTIEFGFPGHPPALNPAYNGTPVAWSLDNTSIYKEIVVDTDPTPANLANRPDGITVTNLQDGAGLVWTKNGNQVWAIAYDTTGKPDPVLLGANTQLTSGAFSTNIVRDIDVAMTAGLGMTAVWESGAAPSQAAINAAQATVNTRTTAYNSAVTASNNADAAAATAQATANLTDAVALTAAAATAQALANLTNAPALQAAATAAQATANLTNAPALQAAATTAQATANLTDAVALQTAANAAAATAALTDAVALQAAANAAQATANATDATALQNAANAAAATAALTNAPALQAAANAAQATANATDAVALHATANALQATADQTDAAALQILANAALAAATGDPVALQATATAAQAIADQTDAVALQAAAATAQLLANATNAPALQVAAVTAQQTADATDATALQAAAVTAQTLADATDAVVLQAAAATALTLANATDATQLLADAATAQTLANATDATQLLADAATAQTLANATDATQLLADAAAAQTLAEATDAAALQTHADELALANDPGAAQAQADATAAHDADVAAAAAQLAASNAVADDAAAATALSAATAATAADAAAVAAQLAASNAAANDAAAVTAQTAAANAVAADTAAAAAQTAAASAVAADAAAVTAAQVAAAAVAADAAAATAQSAAAAAVAADATAAAAHAAVTNAAGAAAAAVAAQVAATAAAAADAAAATAQAAAAQATAADTAAAAAQAAATQAAADDAAATAAQLAATQAAAADAAALAAQTAATQAAAADAAAASAQTAANSAAAADAAAATAQTAATQAAAADAAAATAQTAATQAAADDAAAAAALTAATNAVAADNAAATAANAATAAATAEANALNALVAAQTALHIASQGDTAIHLAFASTNTHVVLDTAGGVPGPGLPGGEIVVVGTNGAGIAVDPVIQGYEMVDVNNDTLEVGFHVGLVMQDDGVLDALGGDNYGALMLARYEIPVYDILVDAAGNPILDANGQGQLARDAFGNLVPSTAATFGVGSESAPISIGLDGLRGTADDSQQIAITDQGLFAANAIPVGAHVVQGRDMTMGSLHDGQLVVSYVGTDEKVHLKVYLPTVNETGDRQTTSVGTNVVANGITTYSEFTVPFPTTFGSIAPGSTAMTVAQANGSFGVFWGEANPAGGIDVKGIVYAGAGSNWSPSAVLTFATNIPALSTFQVASTGVTPGGLEDGFFVSWESTGQGVHGQRYDMAGHTVGTQIVVGDPTTNTPVAHQTTGIDDGRMLVAYVDGTGVSAQFLDNRQPGVALIGPRTGAPADVIVGTVGDDAIDGRARNDQLFGGLGNDFITMGSDADQGFGGDGNDTILGGTGQDQLFGEAGDDLLWGGLSGPIEPQVDRDLRTGLVAAGVSAALIATDTGADIISGGVGNDTVSYQGEFGNFNVDLASGLVTSDRDLNGSFVLEDVIGAIVDDGAGGTIFQFTHDVENATGGIGNDALQGDAGANILMGLGGNDILVGRGGNDTLDGGDGTDVAVFSGIVSNYVFTSVAGAIVVRALTGTDGTDTVRNVETFRFSNGAGGVTNLTLAQVTALIVQTQVAATGTPVISDTTPLQGQLLSVNTSSIVDPNGVGTLAFQWQRSTNGTTWTNIVGATAATFALPDAPGTQVGLYAGNNVRVVVSFVDGLGKTETLTSAATQPIGYNYDASASAAAVNFTGLAGDDVLVGSALADTLAGGVGDDILTGLAGNDTLGGGAGIDTAVYTGAALNFRFDTPGTGISVIDTVGTEGTDTLQLIEILRFAGVDYQVVYGTTGADTALNGATGAAGSQIVFGRQGVDTLFGGDGDDILVGGAGNDTGTGGAGNDIVHGDAGNDTLLGNDGDDTLLGGDDNDAMTGGAGNDFLGGGAGTDTAVFDGAITNFAFATPGNNYTVTDTTGAEGTDTLSAVEVMRFAGVNYTIVAGTTLADVAVNGPAGAAGSQTVFGRQGVDSLFGGDGSDILVGGGGNDTVNGGNGDDFIFYNSGEGRDFIDGAAGADTFVLTGDATAETFRIYTRTAALAIGITGLNANTEIVITRNGTNNASIVAELDNIEEIKINTLLTTANNGNNAVAPDGGATAGDTVVVVGDFRTTSLAYSTIRVQGSNANDTVDISGLVSDHRVVFETNGGSDTFIGDARPQDLVNGIPRLSADLLHTGGGIESDFDLMQLVNQNTTHTIGQGADLTHTMMNLMPVDLVVHGIPLGLHDPLAGVTIDSQQQISAHYALLNV